MKIGKLFGNLLLIVLLSGAFGLSLFAQCDGDGKADLAVFHPSTGVRYVAKISDGGYFALRRRTDGDVPVPVNFDGNAKV